MSTKGQAKYKPLVASLPGVTVSHRITFSEIIRRVDPLSKRIPYGDLGAKENVRQTFDAQAATEMF